MRYCLNRVRLRSSRRAGNFITHAFVLELSALTGDARIVLRDPVLALRMMAIERWFWKPNIGRLLPCSDSGALNDFSAFEHPALAVRRVALLIVEVVAATRAQSFAFRSSHSFLQIRYLPSRTLLRVTGREKSVSLTRRETILNPSLVPFWRAASHCLKLEHKRLSPIFIPATISLISERLRGIFWPVCNCGRASLIAMMKRNIPHAECKASIFAIDVFEDVLNNNDDKCLHA